MRYNEFKLKEGVLQDIGAAIMKYSTKLVQQLRGLLSKLNFGQTKTILIRAPRTKALSESGGIQSLYGYMAEYATCHELTKILHNQGLQVAYRQGQSAATHGAEAVAEAKKYSEAYADEILVGRAKPKEISANIDIQKRAGIELANAMFTDSIALAEDLSILHFEVIHTGESMKHISKADAILKITKKDKKDIGRELKASLKSYRKWDVNLLNTGITSMFSSKNLGVKLEKAETNLLKKGADIRPNVSKVFLASVKKFKITPTEEQHANIISIARKEIEKMYPSAWTLEMELLFGFDSMVNDLGIKVSKGESPEILRNAMKSAWHSIAPTYLLSYVNILQKYYAADKQTINNNILKMLGIDTTDDFYLTVYNDANDSFETVTSKKSEKYKELLKKFHSDFTVKFGYDDSHTSKITVNFFDNDGDLIVKTTLGIGSSGTSKAQKNNWWFPFGGVR